MEVLIADKFEGWGVEEIRRLGCQVTYEPQLKGDALRDAVARTGCQVLVVRSTDVSADVLQAGPSLSLVLRAGAGYNTIDVAAASRLSILVSNCPGRNAVAVAELTFALILALDRRVVENAVDLRKGVWNKKEYSQARGLKGRTLGVIGLGQIGEEVVRRAAAFEMKVVAWSRSLTPEKAEAAGVAYCGSPAEVAAQCDVLSIHLAAAPQTRGLINADVIGRLKPGSFVINTARADVLDYAALAAAVAEKGLRVGLDVFPNEPKDAAGEFRHALLQSGALVYGTHHIGASTDQAQDAIAAEAVRVIREYARTGQAPNCVNLCERSPARRLLVVRHLNRPGVLAHVLGEISRAGINVQEMENQIFAEAHAACARIRLDDALPAEALERIRAGCAHVMSVAMMDITGDRGRAGA